MRGGKILTIAMLALMPPVLVQAQTLYNSPTQQMDNSGASTFQFTQPVPRAAVPSQNNAASRLYTAPNATGSSEFAQRHAALNQWKDQRDLAAHLDQAGNLEYMMALSKSPNPRTFGTLPEQAGPTSYAAPTPGAAPAAVYKKADEDTIQKPRRLFNTFE